MAALLEAIGEYTPAQAATREYQLSDYRQLQHQHDAALALLKLQQADSCVIECGQDSDRLGLTQAIEWMGENVYSLGVLTVAVAANESENTLKDRFSQIRNFANIHGQHGLVIFANGESLLGSKELGESQEQRLAQRMLSDLISGFRKPKVCVLQESLSDNSSNTSTTYTLGNIASYLTLSGISESPVVK